MPGTEVGVANVIEVGQTEHSPHAFKQPDKLLGEVNASMVAAITSIGIVPTTIWTEPRRAVLRRLTVEFVGPIESMLNPIR
jgi:hypothetical protein